MTAAWTIGTFFKIPVRLHYSMLLLLLTYNWIPGSGAGSLFFWFAFMVLVFGSILLHEVGHALMARRFGVHTQDIVLTPIGGIARLLSMPKNPKQEILIAVAGPAVSFALWAGLFFGYNALAAAGAPVIIVALLYNLSFINRMLGLFNLIPALPMDGGRILRGMLALKYDHLTATRKAAKVARVLAVAGGIGMVVGSSMGLFQFQWTALIIALFVYVTAGIEVKMAEMRAFQEQAARQATGPFWTSNPGVRTKTWTFNTSPQANDRTDSYHPPSNPKGSDWSEAAPISGGNVVVVTGGKAKIISRTDPEEREDN